MCSWHHASKVRAGRPVTCCTTSVSTAPWYRKDQLNEPVPLPVLGPDLYNPKDREALQRLSEVQAAAEEMAARDENTEPEAVTTG
jgi:hypothetical protein